MHAPPDVRYLLTRAAVITDNVIVYDTGNVFDVTAGIGPFNASLVQPFIDSLQSSAPQYPYEVLPYSYSSIVDMLLVDPLLSTTSDPVGCSEEDCVSYLITGGLEMLTPWLPEGFSDYRMARVSRAPSIQIDLEEMSNSTFLDSDCDIFGETGFIFGMRLCIAEEELSPGDIRAGMSSTCALCITVIATAGQLTNVDK